MPACDTTKYTLIVVLLYLMVLKEQVQRIVSALPLLHLPTCTTNVYMIYSCSQSYGQKGCLHQCTVRGCCVSHGCLCLTEPQSPGGGRGGAPGTTQQHPGPGSAQQLVQNVIHEHGSGARPRVPQDE